ncbi:unnamed protein product [Psylliodes chrysocephalus]|uniref:Lipase domain-containing protein n=1 Tax=Psylliodes chrysocephalus TaxID=3402493 RepID=A0A9P0C7R0_9CUCU|nr:unnamed protein product [Psylliodes chrysocephala]
MSAMATTVAGLVLVSTVAAVMLIMSLVDGQLTTNSTATTLSGNQNNAQLIDPNGPSVQFVLFTRHKSPINLKIGNEELFKQSGFNTSNPTKIIIHGFTSSIKQDVFTIIRDAYLSTDDYNVIGMDWSVLCEFEYISAMNGVREAGQYLADFIKWLKNMGVSLDDIHLVGHSMGAHVAGVGAGRVKNGKVGRITGLDPARPGYRDNRLDNKLDPNDAILVEGLHTFIQVLGLAETVGHVDFYPNGGVVQPGCPDLQDLWKIGETLVCNHGRAYRLFAESIRDKNAFKSIKCKSIHEAALSKCTEDSDVYMGQPETYSDNGIYYFKTRSKPPYRL